MAARWQYEQRGMGNLSYCICYYKRRAGYHVIYMSPYLGIQSMRVLRLPNASQDYQNPYIIHS